MASWWKGNIGSGLAIGIGSLIIAPLVIPALSKTTRPLVKAAIKGGLVLWGTGKEKLSEAYEIVEDLLAGRNRRLHRRRPTAPTWRS